MSSIEGPSKSILATRSGFRRLIGNPSVAIGGLLLLAMIFIAILAPYLGTMDPTRIDPTARNQRPNAELTLRADDGTRIRRIATFGTDSLGRDIYSRVIFGARVSLVVGATVAFASVFIGLVIGLVSGYFRRVDSVVMRVMDGLMAIPGILFAIGLVTVWGPGLSTVIIAIVIADIPRVVRLVRSIVLTVREEPYVEAAISVGTPTFRLLCRHVLPSTVAPLIVQGTFLCASAMLVEATLSFLGIGISPEIPTWGNIMAEGRSVFLVYPHNILYPSIFLAVTVLAVNMLGDGLRDTLDPKMSKKI